MSQQGWGSQGPPQVGYPPPPQGYGPPPSQQHHHHYGPPPGYYGPPHPPPQKSNVAFQVFLGLFLFFVVLPIGACGACVVIGAASQQK